MKSLKLTGPVFAFILAFSGCQAWEASSANWAAALPQDILKKSSADPRQAAAAKKLLAWGAYAQDLGFPQPSQILKISEKDQSFPARLVSELQKGNSHEPVKKTLDFSPGPGASTSGRLSEGALHFRPYIEEPAPFYLDYLKMPEDRQAEWYFVEAAGILLSPKGTRAQTAMIRDFLAIQLTAGYLSKAHPGIQTLSESYGALVGDRRNFAQLLEALKQTVAGLRVSGESEEAFTKKFSYQFDAWLKDFRSKFTNRFQTNEFVDFGKESVSELSILAIEPMALGYSEIERKYRTMKGGLAELVSSWNSLSGSPESVADWLK